MGKWIDIKKREPAHGDIVLIAGTSCGMRFTTICKIDRESIKDTVWMDAVAFSGHEWDYDIAWKEVEFWQLAPKHPDL